MVDRKGGEKPLMKAKLYKAGLGRKERMQSLINYWNWNQ